MGPNRQRKPPAGRGGRGGRGGRRGQAPAAPASKQIPSMISSAGRDLIIDVLAHAASGGSVPVPEKHFDGASGTRITFQRNSPLNPSEVLQRLFEGLGFPRDLVTQFITDLSRDSLFPSFTNVDDLLRENGELQPFLVQSCFELFHCMALVTRETDADVDGTGEEDEDGSGDNADEEQGDLEEALQEEIETIRSVFSDSFVSEKIIGTGNNKQLELYFCFQSEDEKQIMAAVRVPAGYPVDPPMLYLQPMTAATTPGQTPRLAVLPACTRELSAQARRAVMDAAVETINTLGEAECLVPTVSAIAGAISAAEAEAKAAKPAMTAGEASKKRQEVADRRKAFVGQLKGGETEGTGKDDANAPAAKDDDDDRFFKFNIPEKTALSTVEDTGKYSEQVRREFLAKDRQLDASLKAGWEHLRKNGSLSKNRADLPAFKMREDLRKALQSHNVVVVGGETGSGKTTQIPQYVYEFLCEESRGSAANIVCTQPRRLAATSVALRVAEERDEAVGGTVGYSIRLENCVSRKTQITYCTTGIVLRRLQTDKFLGRVSHVIVDEIHERGVDTDFLLILLRDLLGKRADLKVILMSATMDSDLFARYFGGAPVISIAGRTFPVQVMHLEQVIPAVGYHIEDSSPYARPSANRDARRRNTRKNMLSLEFDEADADADEMEEKRGLAKKIDASAETISTISLMNLDVLNYDIMEHIVIYIDEELRIPGAVLIFLPGLAEIQRCMEQLKGNPRLARSCLFYNLHSSLGSSEQQGVFKRPPPGKRKVIMGTNIMETSITIDDAVFVIDTGKAKENRYNARKSLSELVTVNISKANCRQRQGRAGRVREGFCFRLFTENQYESFSDHQLCEMHRVPLESLILQIYSLHLGDEVAYLQKALTPPEEKAINSSVKVLTTLGALTAEKRLTSLGQHLANLPLDVRIGKMIIHGALLQCVDPVLTMAACLATRSPFITSMDFQAEVTSVRKAFAADYMSDQLSSWFAYSKWASAATQEGQRKARQVCNDYYLSQANLSQIQSTKRQYERYLCEAGFLDDNESGRRMPPPSKFAYPLYVSLESTVYEAGGEKFNSNSSSVRCILACLVAGLYPNIARLKPPRKGGAHHNGHTAFTRFVTFDGSECFVHPSSVAGKEKEFPSKLVVYVDKVKTSATFLREVSMVSPLHVILFSGGQLEYLSKYQELCVDEMTAFLCKEEDAMLLRHLKGQLDSALAQKINDPSVTWESVSAVVVRAIVRLLKDSGSSTQSLTVIDRREPRPQLTENLLPENSPAAPAVPAVPADQPFKTGKTCFICGETGHVSRYCPHSNTNSKGGPPLRCFICGQWHYPVDCPLVKPLKR